MKNKWSSKWIAGIIKISCMFLLSPLLLQAQSVAVPDGFAAYAGTKGGGNAAPITVSTPSAFYTAVGNNDSSVIIVDGKLNVGNISIGSNKTIIGANSASGLYGGRISVKGSNYIFQNLIIGPSSTDAMEISGGTKVFITKCEFYDGADGSLDIVRQSDFVTVSWCKFYYVDQTAHRNTMLIGNGDDVTADRGKLHVTLHHNWWGQNCDQRMPRVRYGQVHIYNEYYGAPSNATYNIGVGFESQIFSESSYFDTQKMPWRYQEISTGGKISWKNHTMVNTTIPTDIPNSITFNPASYYSYTVDTSVDVKNIVMAGAGNFVGPIVPVTGVSLSEDSIKVITGGTYQLTATIDPHDATYKSIRWKSSNTSIAEVSQAGLITGIADGVAYIIVTTNSGDFTDTCLVFDTTVYVPVSGVKISPANSIIGNGSSLKHIALISPSNATNKKVTWKVDNSSILEIDTTGLVKGLELGSAKIIVTTEEGGFKDSTIVSVLENSLPIPLISLNFTEGSGPSVSNAGSVPQNFIKSTPPVWSGNVPENGGDYSLDFGTTLGNYYLESTSVISELAGLKNFTVTGWVNNRSSNIGSGGNRIVSWINNGGNGVDLVYFSNGRLIVGINQWPDNSIAISNEEKITTDINASASNWKYFAVTYRSLTGSLNICFGDNLTVAEQDTTIIYNQGIVGSSIGKLAIGHFNIESQRTSRTDRMFRGLIDQVAIYDSALTLQQIRIDQFKGVILIPVSNISLSPSEDTINVGSGIQLIATILPSNATNKKIKWNSDNPAIATVDSTGHIMGVAPGKAVITSTTLDGNYTAKSAIDVVQVTDVKQNSSAPVFQIYPNPFSNQIFIPVSENAPIRRIEILNIEGQVLKVLELNELTNGILQVDIDVPGNIFVIRIFNETNVFTKKIIRL